MPAHSGAQGASAQATRLQRRAPAYLRVHVGHDERADGFLRESGACVGACTLAGDDPHPNDLAVHGVRDGDDRGLDDVRVREKDVLDLDRKQVLRKT
jgi:hypothetical protein